MPTTDLPPREPSQRVARRRQREEQEKVELTLVPEKTRQPPSDLYPGINDLSDALEAIPMDIVRHFTLLKEIDAKCVGTTPLLGELIVEFLSLPVPSPTTLQAALAASDGQATDSTVSEEEIASIVKREELLAQIRRLINELVPCLEEKMHVAGVAADAMARHVARIDYDFDLIVKNEIPQRFQLGPTGHPAFIAETRLANEQAKGAQSSRSESRREAMAAKKAAAAAAAAEVGGSNISNSTNTTATSTTTTTKGRHSTPTVKATGNSSSTTSASRGRGGGKSNTNTNQITSNTNTTSNSAATNSTYNTNSTSSNQPAQKRRKGNTNSAANNGGNNNNTNANNNSSNNNNTNNNNTTTSNNTNTNQPYNFNFEVQNPSQQQKQEYPSTNNQTNNNSNNDSYDYEQQSNEPISRPGTPANRRVGRQRTRTVANNNASSTANSKDEGEPVYCYCQQVSYGEMVGCDGPDCKREWFHLPCIGLESPPKGQWFCDECAIKYKKRNDKR